MGRIPQEIIDQILDGVDIVEVISGYIPLKKAGVNFKANCPFHDEKTPSFVVSPIKQIYHCFGCSAGGTAINFVMEYESMEFPEAVRLLAQTAGVEVPRTGRDESGAPSISSKLYELNKTAAAFYQNILKSPKGRGALEYLKKRGINDDIISEFMLGYAPDSWEDLRRYCSGKKIPGDLLRKAGLTILSEKGKGDYDRFRKRIIYPVFDDKGNIVAFGGRVLDNSLPKYINSPETPVYSKSNVLYGLNFSKRSIRDKSCAVIVEGYMDVIIPFQHGVTNIVATSGTALTPRQVTMLKRHADTAVMLFDADQAGEAASLRGLDILVENGMDVKVAALPKGEDPDSFVRKNGKEGFEAAVDSAKGLFDYKLDLLIERLGVRNIGGIVDEMLPTLFKVQNAVVQSDYLRRLAERLGVHEASLRYEMGKVKPDYSYRYESEIKQGDGPSAYRSSEIHLLGLAMTGREAFDRIDKELGPEMFQDLTIRGILAAAAELYRTTDDPDSLPGKLLGRFEGDEPARAAIVQAIAKADITADVNKALDDCIKYVCRENRDERLKSLMDRLKKAQAENDDDRMRGLLAEINEIHKERVL